MKMRWAHLRVLKPNTFVFLHFVTTPNPSMFIENILFWIYGKERGWNKGFFWKIVIFLISGCGRRCFRGAYVPEYLVHFLFRDEVAEGSHHPHQMSPRQLPLPHPQVTLEGAEGPPYFVVHVGILYIHRKAVWFSRLLVWLIFWQ